MTGVGLVSEGEGLGHAVVVPLHGAVPGELRDRVDGLSRAGFQVVLVDNGSQGWERWPAGVRVMNLNRGGVAGGFNRGVAAALQQGATWITLLDQDSPLGPLELSALRRAWCRFARQTGQSRVVVGPQVQDAHRMPPPQDGHPALRPVRLLISSGTTFPAGLWSDLGPLREWLFIDFVDHDWCFRIQQRGFCLVEAGEVVLPQRFGSRHPNPLCHRLGLQLYSPTRHYYALRNLRWLLLQSHVPLDLRLKELLKMLVKPLLWLLFEPGRRDNLHAIAQGLMAPLEPH